MFKIEEKEKSHGRRGTLICKEVQTRNDQISMPDINNSEVPMSARGLRKDDSSNEKGMDYHSNVVSPEIRVTHFGLVNE